jgi:hypothetical protein
MMGVPAKFVLVQSGMSRYGRCVARAIVMVGLVASSISARAQPDQPARLVNLITDAPTVVAVSSTVANAAILPAHLVDGDLGTAWNSRTGDLEGAWIGVRVPVDARVIKIRMTIGFTKNDAKLGDLFTMNPRIRKVRVLRNGVKLVEHALDPALRTLQDIPIDQPGGDYKIEVVEILPGTNASWREISVSELEIWGSLPPGVAPKRNIPTVLVGSLDPSSPIAKADCVTTMFPTAKADRLPSGELITKAEVLNMPGGVAVCRVERTAKRHDRTEYSPGEYADLTFADTTIELAPVVRGSQLSAGEHIVAGAQSQMVDLVGPPDFRGFGSVPSEDTTVALSMVPMTSTESALLADVTSSFADPGIRKDRTMSTLYRVTPTQLIEILYFESTSSDGYENDAPSSSQCRLVPPKPQTPMPPTLTVKCTDTTAPHKGKPTSTSNAETYRWNGSRFDRTAPPYGGAAGGAQVPAGER